MGLQLSVLVGCVGALELLACLRHVIVCVMKLTDQPANCCVGYFHRSRISDHDFVVLEKTPPEQDDTESNKQTCSEIEAILRETRSEPDILCLGPPPLADGYVRIPTPIPFGVDDEMALQKSSSNASSLVDSGNENPTTRKSFENLTVAIKTKCSSSSDVSSLEDTENTAGTNVKAPPKKVLRRSRTPEFHGGSCDDYDDGEEEDLEQHQKKHHKASKSTLSMASRRSTRSKPSKTSELGRSAESLSTASISRRSKRHREPERCKSDIQIQVARNLHRDEWTNTSPMGSEADSLGNLSRASSKRSISVLIQTSFEDKLQFPENSSVHNLEVGGSKSLVCPNCRCGNEPRVRRITELGESVDGRPQLVKISSFEEASGDDYDKLHNVINGGKRNSAAKNWGERIKSSVDSESFDEYQDAEEEGVGFCDQPIQFRIPDPGDNQAFWLIFSGEYTKAMNKDWHSGHFCCWQCDESLTGQRYVLRDEHPYCIKCYESVFANGCEECHKIIGIDSKDLSYKDKHWHEACFLCNKCRVSLVDKQFGSKVDKIYCGNCYDAQFASRCDGCGEIFRAGTKKMEYKTRQWHEKCFCCVVCKNAIGTKSFIPREQEIYCAGCYEDKFATRCVKCNKIITSGGVTYKNEPWHRDCFTCSHCNQSLAGQRFTSRDEKPYCADCFGELFAKRCTACTKPITGIGGTRFISFEDRHWHNDCFICAGCKTSLVGRGFITDAEDIICPECAKQKLS
ncbi:zinc finger protein 850 isoform X2 [Nasonia vitripennis]|uniref:LIM zinc-binding domain-containing protein n=1 Tax=Nasonia vitripennis TaxID=7425 RepID=A0A7M7QSH4_NASVI|nr:zinc finger protein 850 isoform X2 [Nasonia vitripennis]